MRERESGDEDTIKDSKNVYWQPKSSATKVNDITKLNASEFARYISQRATPSLSYVNRQYHC